MPKHQLRLELAGIPSVFKGSCRETKATGPSLQNSKSVSQPGIGPETCFAVVSRVFGEFRQYPAQPQTLRRNPENFRNGPEVDQEQDGRRTGKPDEVLSPTRYVCLVDAGDRSVDSEELHSHVKS